MVLERTRSLAAAALILGITLAGCLGDDPPPTDGDPSGLSRDLGATRPAGVLPEPRLTVSVRGGAASFAVSLVGDTTLVAGWHLDFGDDGPAASGEGLPPAMVRHPYLRPPEPGDPPATYTATLTIEGHGLGGRRASAEVTIPPVPNSPPLVALTPHIERGPAPFVARFLAAASDADGTVRSWSFDAGDGSPPRIGAASPGVELRHVYDAIGTYRASFTATDDHGDDTAAHVTVHVTGPRDLLLWSLASNGTEVHAYAADGTTKIRLATGEDLAPGTATGIAAVGGRTFILVDRPGANGTMHILDATSGRHLANATLGPGPNALARDDDDNVFIVHRADARLFVLPSGSVVPTAIDTRLAANTTKSVVPDRAGRGAWIVEDTSPGRVAYVGLARGEADLLVVPSLSDGTHMARSARNDALVILTRSGQAMVAQNTLYGPIVRQTGAVAPSDDARATGLACPPASPHCVATFQDPTTGQSHAVIISPAARPGALAEPRTIALPPGLAARDVVPLLDSALVIVGGPESPRAGALLLDDAMGAFTSDLTVAAPEGDRSDGTSATYATHPRHGRLVYRSAPVGPGIEILDLETGRVAETMVPQAPPGMALAMHLLPRDAL